MKIIVAACAAAVTGAAILTGTPAPAGDRCAPSDAIGTCAPLHLIDHESSISELLRRRAYERGYRDGLHRHEDLVQPRRAYRDRRGEWRRDRRSAQPYGMRQHEDYLEYLERDNPRVQSQR